MKRKQARQLENEIRQWIDKWTDILGLERWRIELKFYKDEAEYVRAVNGWYVATVRVDSEYMQATIEFNLPQMLIEKGKDHAEEVVVHELCHILVDRLDPKGKRPDAEETVVVMLSRSFMELDGRICQKEIS